ncbi:MAG: hypothetical protein JWR55_3382 [Aeromicrobium sp.]|nr:hypothetical protein [Aeromicrobium sp.]
MTTQLDDLTRPAQNPESNPMTGTLGEGVKAVALFESRKPRPWDELSEIDRAVLLESVRQRRKDQAHKQKIYSELFGMRINK